MICVNCGSETSGGKFCPFCGRDLRNSLQDPLLPGLRAGDPEAMARLYETRWKKLYSVAYQVVGNEYDAEDAVQDVFLRLPEKLNSFQGGNLDAWLCTVTRNRALDLRRKQQPINFTSMDWEDEDGSFLDSLPYEGREFSPEAQVDYTETRQIIRGLLEELPEKQRDCIRLRYGGDLKISEIAAQTALPEATVKSCLKYAKNKLEQRITELKKQGVHLFGVSGAALIPFLRWLLTENAKNPGRFLAAPGAAADAAGTAGTAAATGAGAGTSGTVAAGMSAAVAAGMSAAVAAGTSAAVDAGMSTAVDAGMSTAVDAETSEAAAAATTGAAAGAVVSTSTAPAAAGSMAVAPGAKVGLSTALKGILIGLACVLAVGSLTAGGITMANKIRKDQATYVQPSDPAMNSANPSELEEKKTETETTEPSEMEIQLVEPLGVEAYFSIEEKTPLPYGNSVPGSLVLLQIQIDGPDVAAFNQELRDIYQTAVSEASKRFSPAGGTYYIIVRKDNIFSIIYNIELSSGYSNGSDELPPTILGYYYASFDMDTGKQISYNEMLDYWGFDKDAFTEALHQACEKQLRGISTEYPNTISDPDPYLEMILDDANLRQSVLILGLGDRLEAVVPTYGVGGRDRWSTTVVRVEMFPVRKYKHEDFCFNDDDYEQLWQDYRP